MLPIGNDEVSLIWDAFPAAICSRPQSRQAGLELQLEKAISDQSIVRILVVDDFARWRRFVSAIAQKEPGWQVICAASDGLEPVQKPEELTPDLILLDISLPKLSGIEAARQIRKVAPSSKILFVSTYASWEIAEAVLNTGASGYVVKADAGNELAKAVEAVLSGNRSGPGIRDAAIQRIGGAVMANKPGRGEVLLLALFCLVTAMLIASLVRW